MTLVMMKGELNGTVREPHAGMKQDRSCIHQIESLRIIIKQSIEWNSSLYLNCVDHEKQVDSVDKEALWKILRHYAESRKLDNMIKN